MVSKPNRVDVLVASCLDPDESRPQVGTGPEPTLNQVNTWLLKILIADIPEKRHFSALHLLSTSDAACLHDNLRSILQLLLQPHFVVLLQLLAPLQDTLIVRFVTSVLQLKLHELLTQLRHKHPPNSALLLVLLLHAPKRESNL